jgi:hypothetical protein
MYVDPQKARQERERQERERQARIKAEKDRKAKIEAEKDRQAKLKADRKRRAKLKAEQEAAKAAEHPDKKPTEPKPDPKKPKSQTPAEKKPESSSSAKKTEKNKPAEKSNTEEITWSKPGEASPIYGPSALIYEQSSIPIAKKAQTESKPKKPDDRMARQWKGEEPVPETPTIKPYQKRDLSAIRERALREQAAEEQASKEKKEQANLESSETQPDPNPAPLFPIPADLKLASTRLSPGMLNPASAPPSSSPDLKLAQTVQHRITSNKPLEGDTLKIEAIRQTFGCTPAVAQQLLQSRRKTGNIDGMFAFPSLETNKFLSGTPQYQYNVTLSAEEYSWYSKYANSPPILRDIDLTIKEVQQQNWQEVAQGAHEQKSALRSHEILSSRGNYGRLLRNLNQQKLGQDKVPTDPNTQLALLTPEQTAIYNRKLQSIQKVYGNTPISDYLRQSVFDQVQFETRLDVMEIGILGRSLDDKRRKQLEALYQGKSETFKARAKESVSSGFNERWGVDPVFGKETCGKVKRVMRDRYLIQGDRHAMEIAYLGHPLNDQQRRTAQKFYEKLSFEQREIYQNGAQAEYALMWGSGSTGQDAPHFQAAMDMKSMLRDQLMERVYPGQVYHGTQYPAQSTTQLPRLVSPVNLFKENLRNNALDLLEQNKARLNQSQQRFTDPDPKNQNWESLRQQGKVVGELNARTRSTTQNLLEVYRNATGDRVSSPFPLLGTATSPTERRQLVVAFYQQQLGSKWSTLAPQMMPLIDQFYVADALREGMYAQEPALTVLTPSELEHTNTPSENRKLQNQMNMGFGATRGSIGKLERLLRSGQDKSVVLKFDAVVNKTLAETKDPKERQEVLEWVKQQQKKERDQQVQGTLGLAATTVAAVGASAFGVGELALIFGGVGMLHGGLISADGINQAGINLDAVQAGGAGGQRLTAANPHQAQMDYQMAMVNVGLSLLDAKVAVSSIRQVLSSRGAVQAGKPHTFRNKC